MSITDELREWAVNHRAELDMGHLYPAMIEGIADRIDIAHKHAIGYVDDRDPETMAENGWVRLPVDADGEYIRIGDVMEWPDTSTAEVVGIGDGTFFYVEDGEDAAEWSCANDKIHYHAPTVEDVLREFVDALDIDRCEDFNATIAEFAAKLRMAGDGE